MKPTKLHETGRRDTRGASAPEDRAANVPPVGDPTMADVGADAIDHDSASVERALDEIAAGHSDGMSPADVAAVRRAAVGRWDRRGDPDAALLPLWQEAKEHLAKGRPKAGSVSEGLDRRE